MGDRGALLSQTGLSREAIIARMIDTFRRRHGLHERELRRDGLAQAEALAASRFAPAAWTGEWRST